MASNPPFSVTQLSNSERIFLAPYTDLAFGSIRGSARGRLGGVLDH